MKRILLVTVGVALLSGACSKEPRAAVAEAEAAVAAARAAQAEYYAPAAMSAVAKAQVALEAEVKIQSSRSTLTRSYSKVSELADSLKATAGAATAEAATRRQRAQAEAATFMSEPRTLVGSARALARAPKGVVGLGSVHSNLAVVEASLPDIEADVAAGRLKEAKARFIAARSSLDRIIANARHGRPFVMPQLAPDSSQAGSSEGARPTTLPPPDLQQPPV